jgi:hypothetical protein
MVECVQANTLGIEHKRFLKDYASGSQADCTLKAVVIRACVGTSTNFLLSFSPLTRSLHASPIDLYRTVPSAAPCRYVIGGCDGVELDEERYGTIERWDGAAWESAPSMIEVRSGGPQQAELPPPPPPPPSPQPQHSQLHRNPLRHHHIYHHNTQHPYPPGAVWCVLCCSWRLHLRRRWTQHRGCHPRLC